MNASSDKAPWKECPECHAIISCGYGICPECGYRYPETPRKTKHGGIATDEDVLSGQIHEYDIQDVRYYVHKKFGASPEAPHTMRVEYQVSAIKIIKEWICFEHTGFPLEKARKWWIARSNALFPDDSEEAVTLASQGALAPTLKIKSKKDEDNFDRILDYELGEVPNWREPGWDNENDTDPTDPLADPSEAQWLNDEEIPF